MLSLDLQLSQMNICEIVRDVVTRMYKMLNVLNDIKAIMWMPSCTFVRGWSQPYFQILDNGLNTNVRWNDIKRRWKRGCEHKINVRLKTISLMSIYDSKIQLLSLPVLI